MTPRVRYGVSETSVERLRPDLGRPTHDASSPRSTHAGAAPSSILPRPRRRGTLYGTSDWLPIRREGCRPTQHGLKGPSRRMPKISAPTEASLLALTLLLAGCTEETSSGRIAAAAPSNQRNTGGEVTSKWLGDGEIEYELKRSGCSLYVKIHTSREGREAAGVGLQLCGDLPYREKLEGLSLLLASAKEDGRLTNLRRVGPGPGRELCRGNVRERLLRTTLDKLADPEFVRDHPNLVLERGSRLEERYLLEEADAFREYREVFRRIGYSLVIEDLEKVVFEKAKRTERPKGYEAVLGEVAVPCNAMVFFRAERMRETSPAHGPVDPVSPMKNAPPP